jgi:hypothetical protein
MARQSGLLRLIAFAAEVRAARESHARQYADCDYNDERRSVDGSFIRRVDAALAKLEQRSH